MLKQLTKPLETQYPQGFKAYFNHQNPTTRHKKSPLKMGKRKSRNPDVQRLQKLVQSFEILRDSGRGTMIIFSESSEEALF